MQPAPVAPKWICCQLGAREHYSIPRALAAAGRLRALFTDLWAPPGSFAAAVPFRRFRDRFHPALNAMPVNAYNLRASAFEAVARVRGHSGWPLILERNAWFQERVLCSLTKFRNEQNLILFSYSYAARRLFEFAREQGWTAVLGQIDPGPEEERIVARLSDRFPAVEPSWRPAPDVYWENWRMECELADCVVVNSCWSRQALLKTGIPAGKIAVVPLVYEPPAAAENFQRLYPDGFSRSRPLRALFLGQVCLRKGMGVLMEVMRRMKTAPVEFQIAGPIQIAVPEDLRRQDNVQWIGPVPRSQAQRFYREADVFLFPTFSDGFGLTQLEAQAWKLPVIASRFCGEVVEDGRNGILLPEVTADALEAALARCLASPDMLAAMAEFSGVRPEFGLEVLAQRLVTRQPEHA